MESFLGKLAAEAHARSAHWFPMVHERGHAAVLNHYAMGVGGEAGEVVDVIKKADVCGGLMDSCEMHADGKHSHDALAGEIADLLVYALAACHHEGIDPEAALRGAWAKCEERWGPVPGYTEEER